MSVSAKQTKLIRDWLADQPVSVPLFPSGVAKRFQGQVEAGDIADILASLSSQGLIRRGFAVRVPSGSVLKRFYRSLKDIESEVRDQFNRVVPSDDLEILPAFEKAAK